MSDKTLLDLCHKSFDNICNTKGNHWGLDISTTIFFDGNGMAFHLQQVEPKMLIIRTDQSFWEWLAYATLDVGCYHEEIKTVARRFGVAWDEQKLELSITFRRNEMTISQAYFRLAQVVGIVGNFRHYIHFKNKP